MLDSEIAAQVRNLRSKDANSAYASLQALEEESRESDGVFVYFDDFAEMLTDKSGFVRIRGLRLLAANARWDEAGKVDDVLPEFLRHVLDPKPIVARQCIQVLPSLLTERPDLREAAREKLAAADTACYADSMRPLIEKDRAEALIQLN